MVCTLQRLVTVKISHPHIWCVHPMKHSCAEENGYGISSHLNTALCTQMFWNGAKMKAEEWSNNADNYNATQYSIQLFQWQAPLATWLDCDSHAIHQSVAVGTVAVTYVTITDGLPTLLYTLSCLLPWPQCSMQVSLVCVCVQCLVTIYGNDGRQHCICFNQTQTISKGIVTITIMLTYIH